MSTAKAYSHLIKVFGYNERPLFLLMRDSYISLKNRKSYHDEKFCREGTQALQVYKLLDFEWHERKPDGPEVDVSFSSPQLDLQTSAQTQKTLCSKRFFTSRLVTLSSSWMTPPSRPLLSGRKPFNSLKLKASNVLYSDLEERLTPWYVPTIDWFLSFSPEKTVKELWIHVSLPGGLNHFKFICRWTCLWLIYSWELQNILGI